MMEEIEQKETQETATEGKEEETKVREKTKVSKKKPKSFGDNTQRNAFFLTINNPQKYGMEHQKIKEILVMNFPSIRFFCMADEIGGKGGTYHTHVYINFKSRVRVGTVKKHFPSAHIDICKGPAQSNVVYIKKGGKWETTEKAETRVPNTYEEWGKMPTQKGKNAAKEDLVQMIEAGMTTMEIIRENNDFVLDMDRIERFRQKMIGEKYKTERRLSIHVIYIYGATGCGKTRFVMDTYGDENVYRVTEGSNGHPFDEYNAEDVICFEEFRSSFPISDMLNYLDVYKVKLPSRYTDKVACYTKVFFTTNIKLEDQYQDIQKEKPETWKAFLRRIHEVYVYLEDRSIVKYDSVEKYLERDQTFHTIESAEECPFK